MTKTIAQYIDHTKLKPEATAAQILKLCDEAKANNFYAVCVNGSRAALAKQALKDTDVKVAVVVGFPLGAMSYRAKGFETALAVEAGADEIDMVLNVGALKDGDYATVHQDIEEVVYQADGQPVKVIIETCLLTDAEKVKACEIAVQAGAAFVKTSTGFSTAGATVGDIELMRKTVGPDIGVKASGGVRTKEAAEAMIAAGATRIGTASGVAIVTGETSAAKGY